MEKVGLNNVQLDHLAFDFLPDKPDKCGPVSYIVTTDP